MIILRHNSLSAQDLFLIERVMLKVSETSYQYALDYSLLNKPRGEVYGFIAGIFKRIEVYETLGITTSDFLDLLVDIERGYNDNPYHSFYHAVDVTMVLYYMLEEYDMKRYLNRLDLAMVMLAALCHDIGHPGRNNQFEISCKTKRALQYNNLSVLESHSSTLTLALIEKHNILRHAESKSRDMGFPMTQNQLKASIVQMILATDMACHFSLKENIFILHGIIRQHCKLKLTRKKNALSTIHLPHKDLKPLYPILSQDPFLYFEQNYFIPTLPVQENGLTATSPPLILNQQERLMMCQILIHAADISNPCRPWSVFHQLSLLVCVEFFRQGEEEQSLGHPVSPNMNQDEASVSAINISFIDYIVQPYFEALFMMYPKSKRLAATCKNNRNEWLKATVATEGLDSLGNNITSVNAALGGPIRPHVTTAAGTVVIPEHMLEEQMKNNVILPLNRSASFTNPPWILPEDQFEAHIKEYCNQRRKSDDIAMKQMHTKHQSLIATARRKSEELGNTISLSGQFQMVSFSNR